MPKNFPLYSVPRGPLDQLYNRLPPLQHIRPLHQSLTEFPLYTYLHHWRVAGIKRLLKNRPVSGSELCMHSCGVRPINELNWCSGVCDYKTCLISAMSLLCKCTPEPDLLPELRPSLAVLKLAGFRADEKGTVNGQEKCACFIF